MTDFPAVIELSNLDGTDGFKINGEAAFSSSGRSVASAGDVNGDGIDDFIIGAPNDGANGNNAGASYVVFGRAMGFGATLDLASLDGTTGFKILGAAAQDNFGFSVAAAGDVNGDGVDDVIVGAPSADPNGGDSGASYVVFGQTAGFSASLSLSTLDGTNGFRISGAAASDRSGWSVASAGDINGDGIDDLIIGAYRAHTNGYDSGDSYVVFGKSSGFAANLELSALDGTNGFRISGIAAYDISGYSVASAGDVNGDGIDDLIIGAWGADPNGGHSGASYVVFGSNAAFAASLELSTLDGTNGFQISGVAAYDYSGHSVASAGDVNGDGIGDVIIGAHGADNSSGASYVVFGSNGGFAANLNLSTLNGANGFQISGVAASEDSGFAVGSAGDVNGDGIDDLIIGARFASPNVFASGSSYIVFGKTTGFAATLDLADLTGLDGFRINGEATRDYSGWSVAAAGDVNGDGIDDLLIGAFGADSNGTDSGTSYVIYGRASAPAPVVFAGSADNDTQDGGTLDDQLSGQGGNDVLNGLGGDDILDGGDLSDILNGGDGADDLVGGGGGDILSGDAGDDDLNGNDGADKLFGGAGADDLVGGLSNDRLDGGEDIDTLFGNEGNDYLDGGTGADLMTGGTGNDVYIVDDAGDQTAELAGEGYDIVRTARDGWVLADNVEALQLQGAADIDGTGNGGANNLQGNSGGNRLDGGDGVDTISGNDGDDFIIGGLGNDLLRGGTGADSFLIAHGFGPVLETDQVYDFSTAEGDVIDLSDAYDGTLELVAGFTKHAGEMTLTFGGGITTLKLDINGDGRVDYQMKINGDVTGDSGGWML